jgi:diguanylate cyclase (GGDEF)-like protein
VTPENPPRARRGTTAWLVAALLLGASASHALDPSRATTQYHRTVWTAQQGLPGNSVKWLAQDAAGYLVVAGFGRTSLFDGHRFRSLATEIGFHPELYARSSDGTEWFIGSSIARRDSDGVVVEAGSLDEAFHPTSIFADVDGSILVGGSQGLLRITRDSSSPAGEPGIDGPIRAVLRDSSGVLFAATERGLSWKRSGEWEVVSGTEDVVVASCIETGDGAIWLATDQGVMILRDGRVRRADRVVGMQANRVRALLEDRDGNVWAGTASSGLVRFNGDRVDVLGAAEGWASGSISALHQDSDGNLWIGTTGGGLVRLSEGEFMTIRPGDGIRRESVNNLTKAGNGDLWIGTDGGGLYRFREGVLVRGFGPADGLADPMVQSVLETRDGRIIVGTESGVFELRGSGFRKVAQLAGVDVRYLLEDRDGSILLGTTQGLMRWTGLRFISYDEVDGDPIAEVCTIEAAGSGGYWIGGDGFGHFDGERVKRLHAAELGSPIRDIHEDRDGVVWLATRPGLVRIEKDRVSAIEVRGAADGVVHAIVPDNRRRFWLPTNSGLVRVERAELAAYARGERAEVEWITFDETDGLPSGQFNGSFGRMWARDRDGRLWFSSVAGAVSIDPSAPPAGRATPARLEYVLSEDGTPVGNGETLDASRRARLEFHYTAIDLSTRGEPRFRYRLEPIDRNWVSAGLAREAVYRDLPPGTYRFRVEAEGSDGVFRGDRRPFHVAVEPYVHERTSVRLAAVVVLIIGAVSVPVIRDRRMRRRQAELEQVISAKTNELMQVRAELDLVSRTDTLTGLHNRRDFDDRAEYEIARVDRGHGAFSIILADVDHFKQINDKFGRATGDLLLAHVSGVLVESTRRQDVVGRWAGEQFILLLPDTSIEGADLLADKIRRSLEHGDYSVYGGPTSLTATFGVTAFRAGETLEQAVHRAEVALHEGKASGRNRVVRRPATDEESPG